LPTIFPKFQTNLSRLSAKTPDWIGAVAKEDDLRRAVRADPGADDLRLEPVD
jgi:hypothetical protein